MFGKRKATGPDAEAQMKASTPEQEALEKQRDYMERMLTHWIQASERYEAMPNFLSRINGFLEKISRARSLQELSVINTEFTVFTEEAKKFDLK